MWRSSIDFAQNLRSAGTLESSWNYLQLEIEKIGFVNARYGFVALPNLDKLDENVVLIGDYGTEEFTLLYDQQNFIKYDYTVAHCILSTMPITWADIDRKLEAGEFSGKQKEIHQISLDFGLTNGITIPLRDDHKLSRGGLTLQGDPYENQLGFEQYIQEVLPSLEQMAEVFHCNLNRPLILAEKDRLSAREKECLLWSVYGLQVQQIADRIGTHPKTVEKQLYSARKRLKARSTTQAAVKAMILGLIEPQVSLNEFHHIIINCQHCLWRYFDKHPSDLAGGNRECSFAKNR